MIDVINKEKYRRVYSELYCIIKEQPEEIKYKIPATIKENLDTNKDERFLFEYDKNSNLSDYDLAIETKAVLVELYQKYIAPKEEEEFWKKYDKICYNLIEKEKEKNSKELFKKRQMPKVNVQNTESNTNMIEYKESIFKRIMKKFNIF